MPINIEKNLNAEVKHIYYFYKESQFFFSSFGLSFFVTRNNKAMESQSTEHLWIKYNPLVLRVKLPSHFCSNCYGFFLKNSSSSF